MRLQALTVLMCALGAIATMSVAQVSLDMEAIEANAEITSVTLYRGRASVTRSTTLELNPGAYSVFFKNLPISTQLNSVQAHVNETAALLSVDVIEIPVAISNVAILKELNEAIRTLEITKKNLEAKRQTFDLQQELVNTLIEQNRNIEASNPLLESNLESMDLQFKYIETVMNSLASKRIKNDENIRETNRELEALNKKRANIASDNSIERNAIVDIAVSSKQTVSIELTYLVQNATWSPTYSIRAKNNDQEIVIDYDAEISQRTGEDWNDVAVILSTAQPQQSATPPMPHPWYLDIKEPIDVDATRKNLDFSPPSSRSRGQADSVFYGAEIGLVESSLALEHASSAARVDGSGPAINFSIPRTLLIPSNSKESLKTSIASIKLDSNSYRVAVPMQTDKVFIQSEVKNNSPFILLPGEASIFHENDYVGKTYLSTITPSETFEINLGVDSSMSTSRKLVKKNSSNTGLFASGKQTSFEYLIEISNGNEANMPIRLWDRIPVSQNEKIAVALKALSKPLSTDSKYLKSERVAGLLRWDITVPANSSGKTKFPITWLVEITRDKNIEMTPLPD